MDSETIREIRDPKDQERQLKELFYDISQEILAASENSLARSSATRRSEFISASSHPQRKRN